MKLVASKFVALALVSFLSAGSLRAQIRTWYLDFGVGNLHVEPAQAGGKYWNNITTNVPRSGLICSDSRSSSLGLAFEGAFAGSNFNGSTVPDPDVLGALAVPNACADSFYVGGGDVLRLVFSNLSQRGVYRLRLFGSRDTTQTRITNFTVIGDVTAQGSLQTSGQDIGMAPQPHANRSGIVAFESLRPAQDGTLKIEVRRGAGDFGYIGALSLELLSKPYGLPTPSSVTVRGVPRVGTEFLGDYAFEDDDEQVEDGSLLVWEESGGLATASSTLPASQPQSRRFRVSSSSEGKYVRFGVMPVAEDGEPAAEPVYSEWIGPIRPPSYRSLFQVGNSFTRWGSLPTQLKQQAGNTGFELGSGSQLYDGANLAYHWNSTEGGRNPSRAAIATGAYDFMVIQPQSREWQPQNLAGFKDYARRYKDLCDGVGTRLYLYAYWPYRGEPVDMQDAINAAFEEVRSTISGENEKAALIVPVGEVFRRVANEAGTGPLAGLTRMSLYQDDIHPSGLGYYISALTHYATVFRKSPVGLPAQGLLFENAVPVEPDLALRLQEIVWEVVSNYPAAGALSAPALLEFSLGPTTAGAASGLPRFVPADEPGKVAVAYGFKEQALRMGVRPIVEWSYDLQDWTAPPPEGLQSIDEGQATRIQWQPSEARRFMRLRLEMQ